jgi:hypothetical protein
MGVHGLIGRNNQTFSVGAFRWVKPKIARITKTLEAHWFVQASRSNLSRNRKPHQKQLFYTFQFELLNQAVVLIYNCKFDNYSFL